MQAVRVQPISGGLAPIKVLAAYRGDEAFEVRIRDIDWTEPGRVQLHSGDHGLLELFTDGPAGEPPDARYVVETGDGREYPVGQMNFLPPHTSVGFRWSAGHKRSIVCALDMNQLGPLGGMDWRKPGLRGWQDIDPANAFDLRNDRLRAAMQWLAEEIEHPSFGSELQMQCILTMLALELRRHFSPQQAEPEVPAEGCLSTRQLEAVRQQVERCSGPGGPSLAEMAAACGLSGRVLSAMFKRTTGNTLRSYVATTHMQRAKLLLADDQLLIKQVAYRSGFRSAAAFTAAFRQATGLTPQQFRDRCGIASPQECDA